MKNLHTYKKTIFILSIKILYRIALYLKSSLYNFQKSITNIILTHLKKSNSLTHKILFTKKQASKIFNHTLKNF